VMPVMPAGPARPALRVFGARAERIANTSCVSFGGLDAEAVLVPLERAGVVASSGAACSAGGTQPSHVLRAMGLDVQAARSGVRFSLGPATTAADIDRTIAAATAAVGTFVSQPVDISAQPA
jgi:cysteine desulfurase